MPDLPDLHPVARVVRDVRWAVEFFTPWAIRRIRGLAGRRLQPEDRNAPVVAQSLSDDQPGVCAGFRNKHQADHRRAFSDRVRRAIPRMIAHASSKRCAPTMPAHCC